MKGIRWTRVVRDVSLFCLVAAGLALLILAFTGGTDLISASPGRNSPKGEIKTITSESSGTLVLPVTIQSPPAPALGQAFEHVIRVDNPTTIGVEGVEVVLELSPGLAILGSDLSPASIQPSPRWYIERIPERGSVTIRSQLVAKTMAPMNISARATGRWTAQGTVKNTLQAAGSGLTVRVLEDREPVLKGEDVTYFVTLIAQGGRPTVDISTLVSLPETLQFVSASGPVEYSVNGSQVVFSQIPRIDPGDKIELKVVAKAVSEGDAVVSAQVSRAGFGKSITVQEGTLISP